MKTRNLHRFAAMFLSLILSLSLAVPAFAVYEGEATDAPLVGYTVKLNADVPAKLGLGAEIPLRYTVTGNFNQDADQGETHVDIEGYEFYAIVGLKFTYDTTMFDFSYTPATGFTVTDNNGEVTIETPDYFGSYNEDDMPAMKLTVKSDITADQSGEVAVSSDVPMITGYNTLDPMQYTTVIYQGGTGFDPDTGKLVVDPSDTTYNVTFDLNNAEAQLGDGFSATVAMVNGYAVLESDIPTVVTDTAHYVFDGWFNGETQLTVGYVVSSDVTFTAKYTPQHIDIDQPDGTDPENPDPVNPGFTDDDPADGPLYKEDYTGKIDPYRPEVYDYEVSYTNPDTGVTEDTPVTVNPDGTFTIPGKDVTENLDIVITATLKGGKDLEIEQYAAGVAMIRWTRDKNAYGSYTFTVNGHNVAMTYSTDYNAYVALANCSDDPTEYANWKASLTSRDLTFAAGEAAKDVAASRDINGDGSANVYDTGSLMNIFRGAPSMVSAVENDAMQQQYLRADQNHDGKIDSTDYAAWRA